MDFLDKFVIPQSLVHIELLHYLATLVLLIFIPFISIIFGTTLFSLYFRKKGNTESNKHLLYFAKDLISMSTVNKYVGIILGIVPLLTLMIIYVQLLSSTPSLAVTYLFIAFLLVIVALIFIYTYRYSISFNLIFNSLDNFKPSDEIISDDINKLSKATKRLSVSAGYYGVIILVFAIWFYLGGLNLALYPEQTGSQNVFAVLLSFDVISRLLFFFSFAMAITGGAILFRFLFWEGGLKGIDEEYKKLAKNVGVKTAFYFSALIPLFLTSDLLALPKSALSSSIFIYSGLVLLVLFICYNLLYAMTKDEKSNYSGILFGLLIISLGFSLVIDQVSMDNATKLQTLRLNKKYDVLFASLKGETNKLPVINGKDVFQTRCSACHSFDRKIVGPPYNEVLKKYEGNTNKLVGFIMNPKKIEPNYPPMPNPGLKPNEAKAVAKYILETYKK